MKLYTDYDLYFDTCADLLCINTVGESDVEDFYAYFYNTSIFFSGPAFLENHIISLVLNETEGISVTDEIGRMIRETLS